MLKIVIIGDESVGKTSTITKYINPTDLKDDYVPTDAVNNYDFNKTIHCQICDTPGNPEFRGTIDIQLESCNTLLIFYDITSRQSFSNLNEWLNFISENKLKRIPAVFIVGNKKDLQEKREVSFEEGENFAKSHDFHFLETSLNDENDFFDKIIDVSMPIVQNSPEYITQILLESKKSLEKSKIELKRIKNSLKKQPGENVNSLLDVINMLTEAKNTLEERKISLEKSENPSNEIIISLDKSINSIQATIDSLQDSKVVIQNTVSKSIDNKNLQNKEEQKDELNQDKKEEEESQKEKELNQDKKEEEELSQEEKDLIQNKKELSQKEEEIMKNKKDFLLEEEEEESKEEEQDQNNLIQEEEEEEQDQNDLLQEEEELNQEEEEKLSKEENAKLMQEEKELSLDEIELSLDESQLTDEVKKSFKEEKKSIEDKIELYTRTIKILKATKDSSPEMNFLINSIRARLKENKEKYLDYLPQIRCLMLGLDSSGKTTILYRLKRHRLMKTIPTTRFNVEPILHKDVIFYLWDVGGQNHIRSSWKYYFENTDVLIFVVDSADVERIDEAKKELNKLLKEKELEESILLVFANKQDLPNALQLDDLSNRLELNNIENRKWHIQGTNAISGDGFLDGLDWLNEILNLQLPNRDPNNQTVTNKIPKSAVNKLIETICSLENKEYSTGTKIEIVKQFIHSFEKRAKSLSSSLKSTSPKRSSYTENIEVLIKFFKKILFVLENKS